MQDRHDQAAGPAAQPQRSVFARRLLAVLALLLIVLFAGLGTWQVIRLQWKLDLIARVDARVHAEPVAPPPAARWPHISKDADEYRRVRLSGRYLYEFTTPVQAVTSLGGGFWLLTPLCTAEGTAVGHIVFINRGFIPTSANMAGRFPARRAHGATGSCTAPGPTVEVTGLLRLTEPGGGFLRDNDPATNRWFSRDVEAIAAARGLTNVAPFFVDAGRDQDPPGAPERAVGGLTVVKFQNNHLVYALTWYALALMVLGAWWWVVRHGRKHLDA
jgi:surfeit locus 1 family protein